MKAVVSSVSLFLAVLHLAGTISVDSVQAQVVSPTLNITDTTSLAQGNQLLAKAVPPHLSALDQGKVSEAVPLIEQTWEKEFEGYFRTNFTNQSTSIQKIAGIFRKVANQTGKKSALIYMVPRPDQLELVLITSDGQPVHKQVKEANKEVLLKQVRELTNFVTNPIRRNTTRYLPAAQQLYQWMIAPLESELQAQNIDTLLFCVGSGLRAFPLAALHDGKQFLVEKYSFSRIPAFKLTNTVYADLRNSQVLAMGASEFKEHNPLPAVPVELSAILKNLWQGKSFLNEEFTLTNLEAQQALQPYKIIHLATHASFQSGRPRNSYVQFWDSKLTLDKMRQVRWNTQPELLVLSACRTAFGDQQAELGFAGLAVEANVKSAIASLWDVSDEGTLGLMIQLYRSLKTAPIKAEALRQAQISMLKGQLRIEDGQLQTPNGRIPLPSTLATIKKEDLSSPYYWSAFTVVGSPW